ncbi:hypothetical protein [Streptomyces rubellomurinus]|uniref:Uncharacterized protein n=1 Tax=Streptomyces rubellomurinus (strain ATCC 31215) TaxID=359131 RepID=A0A0F2TJC8_STRR3|nr:hypothetical protein [Streptomyces rubellomurinus]KJS63254.1 hypothetical protein VM95_03150 [Streptomyces rubellomurinus]
MDGWQRRTTAAIAREARRDRALDVLVSAFAFGLRSRAWELMRGVRPRTALVLVLLSLALLVAGLRSAPAAVVWVFAGLWTLALAIAFAVLCACADDDGPGR